ncbi:hypothetical protein [Natronorubrum daqingense]|uniref:Uncharacterized protein n=1 Tax=Natronorubrum daqingense TaxID=588898 RepID=A0A1N6ZYF4_9EURY|nr:hypothetical protein [Natronorubrum daqingense]APX95205.1 hypothetical protein BB347_00515 [Natronorubrum daqingense]SIR31786.1 hypothetical protein SAMN05421809_0961 [Natronorubrum daqingense]
MTTTERYRSHLQTSVAATVGCLAVVAVVTAVTGRGLTFVADALFVLAVGCFGITVVLTRPSVSRRRKIQRAQADDESTGDDREPDGGRSRVRDPNAQFHAGIRLGLVATTLLCVSLFVQYAPLR